MLGQEKPRSWRHRLPVVLLLPVLAVASHAMDTAAIHDVLTTVHTCRSDTNPALAVAIVKDGQVVMSSGYGVTRVGSDERVNGSTRFNIASLSKAFAATLLLKVMHEDKRYNLTSKVRDILGQDLQFSDELRTKEASVEDLLSHKMAIPANNRLRFNSNLTRANLKDRLKYLPTKEIFRTVYIYSNLMYGLATYTAEVIGKASWEDLLRRHLFRPLGMTRSTFIRDAISDQSGMARPYRRYFGDLKNISSLLPPRWSELAGSGAVVSTADDMAEWMKFHLSQGKGPQDDRIMEESLVKELYKPRTAMDKTTMSYFLRPHVPVTFAYDVYNMGFRTGYYRGFRIVGHGGSSFGYRSLMTLMPSQKLGIFTVMSGSDSKYVLRGPLHAFLMDQALDVPSWLNVSTLCSFPEPWYKKSSSKLPYNVSIPLDHSLCAYLGHYYNPAYGILEVKQWQNGSDEGRHPSAPLTVFYGFGTWDLLPSTADSPPAGQAFYGKGRNITAWVDYSPFVFHTPPAGSDVIQVMSVPGFEKKSPPVFVRVALQMSQMSDCSACSVHYGLITSFWLPIQLLVINS